MSSEQSALDSLLAAEHAAVYAYGVLGARLDDRTREVALTAFDEHRLARNRLLVVLRARGISPPGPAAGYDVAVADQLEALRLAIRVETELGVRWRDLAGASDDAKLRKMAVDGLTSTALRSTRWRRLAKVLPLTEPFPGQA